MTERRLSHDRTQRRKQISLEPAGKTAQQHGAVRHRFPRRADSGNGVEQIGGQCRFALT